MVFQKGALFEWIERAAKTSTCGPRMKGMPKAERLTILPNYLLETVWPRATQGQGRL